MLICIYISIGLKWGTWGMPWRCTSFSIVGQYNLGVQWLKDICPLPFDIVYLTPPPPTPKKKKKRNQLEGRCSNIKRIDNPNSKQTLYGQSFASHVQNVYAKGHSSNLCFISNFFFFLIFNLHYFCKLQGLGVYMIKILLNYLWLWRLCIL